MVVEGDQLWVFERGARLRGVADSVVLVAASLSVAAAAATVTDVAAPEAAPRKRAPRATATQS